MIGPFRDRCSVLGISLETPLEKILEMEFENLNGVEDEDSRLAYIRVCEIDALGLDSHGIVSFDAKQVLRSVNYLQKLVCRGLLSSLIQKAIIIMLLGQLLSLTLVSTL